MTSSTESRPIRILIVGELYKPLIPWFLSNKKPQGAPAVYELYQYLGSSPRFQFTSFIYSKTESTTKYFPNGSTIELVKLSFPNHYAWKLIAYIKLLFKATRALKTNEYDLVYGLSNFASIAAIAGKYSKTPSVGRIYGTILTKAVENKSYLKLYTRFVLDVLAIKLPADLVIATQDGTAYDQVFSFFNKSQKPYLLLNGIDKNLKKILLQQSLISILPKHSRINLAYIARLESYKRQELAIDLVANLISLSDIKVHLTLLGSGSQKEKLVDLVQRRSLEEFIHFKEEIPHEELPFFLQSQHICLFFYEGGSLGNTLWECALAGKLLATIDSGQTAQFLSDGKSCLSVKDDENAMQQMAQKIADLYGQDISPLTSASRQFANESIVPWENRLSHEFNQIEATLL